MGDTRLYQDELMDHYLNPRHRRKLENPDLKGYMFNPSCGDAVAFELKLNDGIVQEVGFQGSGCVISQATASIVSQFVLGKTLRDIKTTTHEDILALIKVSLGPTRLRCALLSLQALQLVIPKEKN